MATPLLCISTCPDAKTAGHIARTLVKERLAACVNQIPGITSTYRWQGKVEDSTEIMLVIKTTRACFAALRARLLELSPYQTPELIALDITDGSAAYLDWLAAETTGSTPG